MTRARALVVLVPLLGLGCEKKWDWTEHFEVECMVLPELGEVSVSGRDIPSGALVSAAELPGLEDTINDSGIYMTRASLVPLAAGPQTLTFTATHADQRATTTCAIERPVFPALAHAVANADLVEFARAQVVFSFALEGTSAAPMRADVGLGEDGRLRLRFQAWKPSDLKVEGEAIEANELGVFEVPVAASGPSETTITFANPDHQQASYRLSVSEVRPWSDLDTGVLAKWTEGGLDWAAPAQAAGSPSESISALLLDDYGTPIAHVGPMRVLAEVERVARVTLGQKELEVCHYSTPDGHQAKMTRYTQTAEVVVRAAKTGEELARKQLATKPGPCPDAADFTFTRAEGASEESAWDQTRVGDVMPEVLAWFEKSVQK